jgi:predicted metalloprotease
MRWIGRRASGNFEDRRGGFSGGGVATGGGVIGVIGLILYYLLSGDSSQLQTQLNNAGNQAPMSTEQQQAEDSLALFSRVVLADCEDVWTEIFREKGMNYRDPVMVLFNGGTQSGCGNASSATGPFYCPADNKVYLDLTFFNELKDRFSAPGDFAIAYVIAHEVGHHVQYLLGTSDKVQQMMENASEKDVNRLSVKLELQADFYAGVWAHYDQKMKNVLEPGDIEEALGAASAVGDDRLQKESQGRVVPDAFTHGTSQQRMYWFKKGYQTGDISQGDTFNATDL